MAIIEINRDPPRRTLNLFGVAWLVFISLAGLSLYRNVGTVPAVIAWSLAVGVAGVGWCRPAFMRVVFVGLCYAVLPIGLVMSILLMAVTYYVVFTLVAVIMRIVGYDPMKRTLDRQATSYWIEHDQPTDTHRYFRQY